MVRLGSASAPARPGCAACLSGRPQTCGQWYLRWAHSLTVLCAAAGYVATLASTGGGGAPTGGGGAPTGGGGAPTGGGGAPTGGGPVNGTCAAAVGGVSNRCCGDGVCDPPEQTGGTAPCAADCKSTGRHLLQPQPQQPNVTCPATTVKATAAATPLGVALGVFATGSCVNLASPPPGLSLPPPPPATGSGSLTNGTTPGPSPLSSPPPLPSPAPSPSVVQLVLVQQTATLSNVSLATFSASALASSLAASATTAAGSAVTVSVIDLPVSSSLYISLAAANLTLSALQGAALGSSIALATHVTVAQVALQAPTLGAGGRRLLQTAWSVPFTVSGLGNSSAAAKGVSGAITSTDFTSSLNIAVAQQLSGATCSGVAAPTVSAKVSLSYSTASSATQDLTSTLAAAGLTNVSLLVVSAQPPQPPLYSSAASSTSCHARAVAVALAASASLGSFRIKY